jgi:hypothetical protein
MSSDTLTVTSRNFFERTKAKLWQSVVVASAGLMLLGFCAISGGEAKANNEYLDRKGNDDHTDSAYGALASGYGKLLGGSVCLPFGVFKYLAGNARVLQCFSLLPPTLRI